MPSPIKCILVRLDHDSVEEDDLKRIYNLPVLAGIGGHK